MVLYLFAAHSSMNPDVEGRDILDFNLSIHLCLGSILKRVCLKIILFFFFKYSYVSLTQNLCHGSA